jgi:uncharacterized ParB-like nuclease family protein
MTRTTPIAIADIVVASERMRKLRPDVVDSLAESITRQGLLQPIIVRPRGAKNYWLIAGRHRLAAVEKLGRNKIEAIVLDGLDADSALLAEIDENLVRADLSPAERALHIGKRKELYEKVHPQTKHGAVGRGGKSSQNENSFVADVAEKTGKGRSTVARDVTRANKVVVLPDIIGTSLDEGSEIDALGKLPEGEQRKLAKRAKAGKKIKASVEVMKLNRERREQRLADATERAATALGRKVYGVIYCDPPWQYTFIPIGDVSRAVERHYTTMPLDDIKALRIPAA